ncbi:MAG: DinB family protein [Gemmatimonadaceae bacterium]|nr:DinB family protein [Gemmatimonadaceae bacterium]
MPTVNSEHFRAIIDTSSDHSPDHSSIIASRYESAGGDMVLGIPALFPKADWAILRSLTGDRGAKSLFSIDTLSVFLRLGSFDLDTPSDVARWRAEQSPSSPPLRPMSSSIAQSVLADLDHEIAQTRRMLERVPADHLDFTPHPKSWPLQKLANHLTDFPMWGVITLKQDVLDFAVPFPPGPPVPTTAAGFVAQFDERMAGFTAALAEATDAQMMETWTMKNGDEVLMAMPRIAVLRGMVVNHMIHHRAQLTIYYRLVGVPVPGSTAPARTKRCKFSPPCCRVPGFARRHVRSSPTVMERRDGT